GPLSFGLLLACLVAVMGLAKKFSPTIEHAVEAANAPPPVVGIVIATLVLFPQTWAAVPAAPSFPRLTLGERDSLVDRRQACTDVRHRFVLVPDRHAAEEEELRRG